MEITVHRLKDYEEVEEIFTRCLPKNGTIAELDGYRHAHFDTDGNSRGEVYASYPEIILIAKSAGNIIGYLHFYVDCYDGTGKHINSAGTSPILSPEDAEQVRKHLREAYESYKF